MSEAQNTQLPSEFENIMSITPEGVNAIVYWYHVAQDAMRTVDKEHAKVQNLQHELDMACKDYTTLANKLIDAGRGKTDIPDTVKAFIDRGMDVHVNFSFYPSENGGANNG